MASNNLNKLKAYRHGEDHDFLYEDGHHWNVKGFDVSDSEFDFEGFQCNEDHDYIYEDGHNFKGFDVDSDFDFKEYKDKFINMLQNLKEKHLELRG